jgi:hypothetical protein
MDTALVGTSPITSTFTSLPFKRSRFNQLPSQTACAQVPLPPPGVVFLTSTDNHTASTVKVDPKANLLSQLFLHSGLYNMQTPPEDLRSFYRSFFRPLVNPQQIHDECSRALTEDLRRVMTRDIRKRVVDSVVFKALDAWTEKNQREYNERVCCLS